jgi:hypothetical protein
MKQMKNMDRVHDNMIFTFIRVSILSPCNIHITSAQNKQKQCIEGASKVGHSLKERFSSNRSSFHPCKSAQSLNM